MPEIQGYTTGSKTSELFEATITQSGEKHFLDVNIQAADTVQITNGSINAGIDERGTSGLGLNTLPLAEFRSSAPILTDGEVAPFQLLSDGTLKVLTLSAPSQDRINEFNRVSPGAVGSTLVTTTVSGGKFIDITSWHFSTESAIALVELQIDGVPVDAIRFANSANTNRVTVDYGNGAIQASGGEVIRVQFIEGDTGKEFITGFIGNQGDA